jgi:hypothetical protein
MSLAVDRRNLGSLAFNSIPFLMICDLMGKDGAIRCITAFVPMTVQYLNWSKWPPPLQLRWVKAWAQRSSRMAG